VLGHDETRVVKARLPTESKVADFGFAARAHRAAKHGGWFTWSVPNDRLAYWSDAASREDLAVVPVGVAPDGIVLLLSRAPPSADELAEARRGRTLASVLVPSCCGGERGSAGPQGENDAGLLEAAAAMDLEHGGILGFVPCSAGCPRALALLDELLEWGSKVGHRDVVQVVREYRGATAAASYAPFATYRQAPLLARVQAALVCEIDPQPVEACYVSNYFNVVRLADGSTGTCMSYSKVADDELERVRRYVHEHADSDPWLLSLLSSRGVDNFGQSLWAALLSARSAQALLPGHHPGYLASHTEPFDPLAGGDKVVVIGFGGYMEDAAQHPEVRRLHIADLGYRERRAQMNATVARFNRRGGGFVATVSDGSDTQRQLADADVVFITGSTLSNGTLDLLLRWACHCRVVAVQGQSAGVHPRALFDSGANLIITTRKPADLIEAATGGQLAEVLENGFPNLYMWPTTASDWFEAYDGLWEDNGYAAAPRQLYRRFLQWTRPGAVMELGCGNGLLLRYLADHSRAPMIVPMGMESKPECISTARQRVFPSHAENFQQGDLLHLRQPPMALDLLITNPLYADEGYRQQDEKGRIRGLRLDGSIQSAVARWISWLAPGGRLVLFCYPGQMAEIAPQHDGLRTALSRVADFREFRYEEATFFVFDAPPEDPR